MKNKREYTRIRMTDNIKAKGLDTAKGVDVSVNGIGIITDKKLKLGDIVELEFSFPNMHTKSIAQAKVVWQRKVKEGYHTGLEFEKLHLTIRKN